MELSGLFEGRFKLLGPLGKDEIGVTFLVEDQNSGKQAALRKLRSSIVFDTDLNEALIKGFERAQGLMHPHICAIEEFLTQEDSQAVLILMEYVQGETLRDFLFKLPNYRCDEATCLGLSDQILSAMEHAHQAGVTHRDITPDNVMITTQGSVKVIDFGIDAIVKEANFRRWNNPIFLSTFYVSPEQIAGEEPSPSMDIYSLGCLFYEMLAGKLPFREKDIVDRQAEDTAESIPGVSEGLNNLILQCLNTDKSQRPQSVEEIQGVLAGHEVPGSAPPEVAPVEPPTPAPSASVEAPPQTPSLTESGHDDPVLEARALSRQILGEEVPAEEAVPAQEAQSKEEAVKEEAPDQEVQSKEEAVEKEAPKEESVPPDVAPPEVVPKVLGDEEAPSEVADEEWVPDEDLPFAVVEKKESSRRVLLIGGVLVLVAAALWWYQSSAPAGGPPIGVTEAGVTEESLAAEDLRADLPEEPAVDATPQQQPVVGDQPDQAPQSGSLDTAGLRPRGASLSNGYTIQVGAFRTELAARQVLQQLSEKSHSGRIDPTTAGADGLYRVSVGDFASRNEALQVQTRLKADGFPTFIKQLSGR